MTLHDYLAGLDGADTPVEQVEQRQLVRWYGKAAEGRCVSNGYRYLVGRALSFQVDQLAYGQRVEWKTEIGKLTGLSRRSVDLLIQVGEQVHELLSNARSGNALPSELLDHPWRDLPGVLAAALRGEEPDSGEDDHGDESEADEDDEDGGSWDTVKWTVWDEQRERQLSEVWDSQPEVRRLAQAYRQDAEKLEARLAELADGTPDEEDASDEGTLAPPDDEEDRRADVPTERTPGDSDRGRTRRGTPRRRGGE